MHTPLPLPPALSNACPAPPCPALPRPCPQAPKQLAMLGIINEHIKFEVCQGQEGGDGGARGLTQGLRVLLCWAHAGLEGCTLADSNMEHMS